MFPNHALRNAIEEYFQEIQSVNRRAVWKTIHDSPSQGLESNAPFLRTIDALMQCSLLMNADLSIDRVLKQIMEEARTLVGAEVASVFLVDESSQELYSVMSSNGCELRIPMSAGIAGHVVTSGEAVIVHDTYGDTRFTRKMDAQTGFRTCDMMCVPLKGKKGDVFGVVQLINKIDAESSSSAESGRDLAACFSKEDLQFLQVFASQAAMAVLSSGFSLPRESSAGASPLGSTTIEEAGVEKPHEVSCLVGIDREVAEPRLTFGMTLEVASCNADNAAVKRKSGRARQRAAKYWAKVRQRTPSPGRTMIVV